MSSKYKILVVDDSSLYRQVISRLLSELKDAEVVGSAANGKEALEKIRSLKPNLITLDMEMPEMDGLATLSALKTQFPDVKALVLSHHTEKGAEITLQALRLGAIDFITKPAYSGSLAENLQKMRTELLPRIKSFIDEWQRNGSQPSKPVIPKFNYNQLIRRAPRDVIAIGSSTGGPNCLTKFFKQVPNGFQKPILIVQHMPPIFTQKLAAQLSQIGHMPVKEAEDMEPVRQGQAYIAPGDYHMEVEAVNGQKRIRLHQGPKENFCRPAVDVLFRSVATVYGKRAIGVILTGMGSDGLKGSRMLKESGAPIIAQDKETSVVWGMPGFVVSENLADAISPDDRLFETINEFMF